MNFSWIEANNPISFPALGLEIDPPLGFSIGSLSVRFYGVIIAIGLILAVYYGLKRSKHFGLKENDILDGVLWIVPVSIIFARAYYCIFSWHEFADNPISVLYIWKGGIAIYGGVIGAALGVIVHSLIKKVKLAALLDLVAVSFLIGQFIGRWGNFINREAFGGAAEGFLRMEIYSSYTGARGAFHPTFLYESCWNLVGFLALHFLTKKRQYDGQLALGYVAWYGLGRTLIEGLRVDSLYWGPFRVSQLLAAITCFLAATVLVFMAFRRHDRENLYVNVVAKQAELAAAAVEEEAVSEEGGVVAGEETEAIVEEETQAQEEENDQEEKDD